MRITFLLRRSDPTDRSFQNQEICTILDTDLRTGGNNANFLNSSGENEGFRWYRVLESIENAKKKHATKDQTVE